MSSEDGDFCHGSRLRGLREVEKLSLLVRNWDLAYGFKRTLCRAVGPAKRILPAIFSPWSQVDKSPSIPADSKSPHFRFLR